MSKGPNILLKHKQNQPWYNLHNQESQNETPEHLTTDPPKLDESEYGVSLDDNFTVLNPENHLINCNEYSGRQKYPDVLEILDFLLFLSQYLTKLLENYRAI